MLDPSAFASADFKHLATCQMQHSLLKVTLTLTLLKVAPLLPRLGLGLGLESGSGLGLGLGLGLG